MMEPGPVGVSLNTTQQTEAKTEKVRGIEDKRRDLKSLVDTAVDTLTFERIRNILRDITFLEKVLIGKDYPKEVHPHAIGGVTAYKEIYKKARNRFLHVETDKAEVLKIAQEELKSVMNGIINTMHISEVELFEAEPIRIINLLRGEKESRIKEEAAIPETEDSPEIKAIVDLAKHKSRWVKFDWGNPENLLSSVEQFYYSRGIKVKVEFFRPNDENYSKKIIVIAEDKEEKETGIAVPRPGTVLDVTLAFDLFKWSKPGETLTAASLSTFPQVRREYKDANLTQKYWRVTKLGKMRKYGRSFNIYK
jgi:hypothetical protein